MPDELANSELMTEDEKLRLLTYLKRDLEREQAWRDAIAKENGWAIHPNDVEPESE